MEVKGNTYAPITRFVLELSERQGLPASTLRWSYQKLRSLGLIECGTSDNKSVTARLTSKGEELADALASGE